LKNIIYLYLIEKLSARRIASLCNLSVSTVYCRLHKSGITLRKRGRYRIPRIFKDPKERDQKDLLIFLYIDLDLTSKDLSKILYCTEDNVVKLLRKHKIKKRKSVEDSF